MSIDIRGRSDRPWLIENAVATNLSLSCLATLADPRRAAAALRTCFRAVAGGLRLTLMQLPVQAWRVQVLSAFAMILSDSKKFEMYDA